MIDYVNEISVFVNDVLVLVEKVVNDSEVWKELEMKFSEIK